MDAQARALMDELERVKPDSPVLTRARLTFDIAEETGVKPSGRPVTTQQEARREVALRKIAERDESDAEVKRLYEAGLSLIEVGKRMGGHSTAWVTASLFRTGTPSRPRGNTRQRDPERIERLRAMRDKGMTLEEMGAAEQITRERVRQICTTAGIDTSINLELTDEQRAAVAEYMAGDSMNEVAVRYGIGTHALRNWILKAGHVPRKQPSRRDTPEIKQRAKRAARLYQRGMKGSDIAKALGLPKSEMIYRLLAIAGVHPNRNPGSGGRNQARH